MKYATILLMKNKIEIRIENIRYSLNEIRKNYEKKIFRIPKYQRGYVWKSSNRDRLIDSIIRGYPIGSIIIWTNKNYKYILDGQQRTRSLLEISKLPFKDMKIETFLNLFENSFEKEKQNLTEILKWLRNKKISCETRATNSKENITNVNTIKEIRRKKKISCETRAWVRLSINTAM